jgi:hypothetical protein
MAVVETGVIEAAVSVLTMSRCLLPFKRSVTMSSTVVQYMLTSVTVLDTRGREGML